MTISTTARKAGPFTGNGSTAAFPFTFKVFLETDLEVVQSDLLDVEETLELNSDYSVALNADQDNNPGGTITLSTPLIADYGLVIVSAVPYLQPTALTNMGGFFPETVNDALDRLTMQVQQLRAMVLRSIQLPVTAEDGEFVLPLPTPNALIVWNEDGDGLTTLDPAELIQVVAAGDAAYDVFTGNGVTVSFALSSAPGQLANLRVSIDGVVQVPGYDYTLPVSQTLSFVSAPPADTRIFVQYQSAA